MTTVFPTATRPTSAPTVDAQPETDFKAAGDGTRNAISQILEAAEQRLLAGDTAGAIRHLENLRRRLDGCGAGPDPNDWIVRCEGQLEVRAIVDLLLFNLSVTGRRSWRALSNALRPKIEDRIGECKSEIVARGRVENEQDQRGPKESDVPPEELFLSLFLGIFDLPEPMEERARDHYEDGDHEGPHVSPNA